MFFWFHSKNKHNQLKLQIVIFETNQNYKTTYFNKATYTQLYDLQAEPIKPEDAKPAEAAKPSEAKPDVPKPAEAKLEEPKPAEAKPEEPKAAEAIPEASTASVLEQPLNGVPKAGPSQQNSELVSANTVIYTMN